MSDARASRVSVKINSTKSKRVGFYQWKALITSFLIQSLIFGTLESFGALYVPIRDTLLKEDSMGSTKAALVGSLTTGCLMGFSPISNMLIDKVGAQLIAVLGGVIVFLALFISSFMSSFYLMAFFYGIMFGIGSSMLFISSNVVIARYFEENSTVAYGILGLGNGLMNSIMPHVISYCIHEIQLGGTIRIICFLLSSIMFYPLYWSSVKPDENEEVLIAYFPAKPLTHKLDSDRIILGSRDSKPNRASLKLNTEEGSVKNQSCAAIRKPINFIDNTLENSLIYVGNSVPSKTFKNSNFINFNMSNEYPNSKTTKRNEIINDNDITKEFIDHFIKINQVEQMGISGKIGRRLSHDYNNMDRGSLHKSFDVKDDSLFFKTELLKRYSEDKSVDSSGAKEEVVKVIKKVKCFQAEVFSSKTYVTLLFGMFIAMFGYQVPNVHIVNFAHGISSSYNGQLLLTCLGGSSAVGPFINGIMMDKFNCKISKYRLYQIFVIAYGIFILLLSVSSNYTILIFNCMVIGFLDGSFSSLIGPLAIDLVGAHRAGQALGIFFGVIAPSVTIAPPLAGFIYESFNSYKQAFFGSGLFFIIGGLILSFSHTFHSISQEPVEIKDSNIQSLHHEDTNLDDENFDVLQNSERSWRS